MRDTYCTLVSGHVLVDSSCLASMADWLYDAVGYDGRLTCVGKAPYCSAVELDTRVLEELVFATREDLEAFFNSSALPGSYLKLTSDDGYGTYSFEVYASTEQGCVHMEEDTLSILNRLSEQAGLSGMRPKRAPRPDAPGVVGGIDGPPLAGAKAAQKSRSKVGAGGFGITQ